jgi:hypothetical protein
MVTTEKYRASANEMSRVSPPATKFGARDSRSMARYSAAKIITRTE